jgi:histidinol phosphatase-like PHP family hydrolase
MESRHLRSAMGKRFKIHTAQRKPAAAGAQDPRLECMRCGIGIAKRAWLTKEDVIDTMGLDELMKESKKSG